MKIFMGFQEVDELPVLLDAGAHEFYTGFHSGTEFALRSQYPPYAALRSFDELDQAIRIVRRAGSKLFIALNALYYSKDDLAILPKAAQHLIERGADGVIVASFPLLLALSRAKLNAEICLSTLQPAFSSTSLAFFKSLGITRMVLAEQTGAFEVDDILRDPDIQTEAFTSLINDHPHTESYCLFHHRQRTFCPVTKAKEFRFCGERPAVAMRRGEASDDLINYVSRAYVHDRPYRINNAGNLYHLYHLGLDYLKLGCRRMDIRGKLACLSIATGLLDLLENGVEYDEFVARALEIKESRTQDFTKWENPYF